MRTLFLVLAFCVSAWATDNCSNLPAQTNLPSNGLGSTPLMGWNSWGAFGNLGTPITETIVKAQADALISTGLAAKGYIYVNIDDGWPAATRTGGGDIQPN